MSKKIDCRIVQDLLPMYIDGLTCEYTNEVVKDHLNECEQCKQIFEYMQEPEKHAASEEKEVDYMIKVRERMSNLIATAFISVGILILGILVGVMIYNRVTPKEFQDVFVNDMDTLHLFHPLSGVQFDLDEQSTEKLQKLLESANFYYEGRKENVIEGDLFHVFNAKTDTPYFEFVITDQNKLYYNEKVYDIRDCEMFWGYLETILYAEPAWAEYLDENYSYLDGYYQFGYGDIPYGGISFELNFENKTFHSLGTVFSSVYEEGTVEIDGLEVVLKSRDNTYVFYISNENVLTYDAERSDPLYLPGSAEPIPNGSSFISE